MLAVAATTLLVVFLTALIRNIFPIQILVPTWQLRFTGAILDNALFPLIALVLLNLAVFIDQQDLRLKARHQSFSRWAIYAALGFLLLIPLQASATMSNIEGAIQARQERQRTIQNQFAVVRLAINSSKNSEDLRTNLEALQGQAINARGGTDFSRPLPELKKELLQRLDDTEERVLDRLKSSAPPVSRTNLVLANLTAGASAVAYSLAFAAAGHRPHKIHSLYDEWRLVWVRRRERAAKRRIERMEQREDLREILSEQEQSQMFERARQARLRYEREQKKQSEPEEEEYFP